MRTLAVLALAATAAHAQMPGMMGGNILMGPGGGSGGMPGGPGGMTGPPGGMPPGGPPPWLADMLDPDAPPPSPPPPWSGIIDLGANGQTGNTDLLSFRANAQVSRKTDRNLFTLSATYMLTRLSPTGLIGNGAGPPGLPPGLMADPALANAPVPGGQTITQQQSFAYLWDEFLEPGRVWNPFVSGLFEYDEFRDYKYRAGSFAGLNGHLLDGPERSLAVRVGAGAVYETGGVGSRWVPEGLAGFTGSRRFWDRHSLSGGVDLFPRLTRVGQYRLRASASWDILLDPDRRYVLRLGVQDRYDSDPGRKKRNDLSYFSSLGVRF